jgi:Protein of unknown function (DUF4235)
VKFIFIPFSIVSGLIAGMIGKKLFEQLWSVVDDEDPPESEHREATWGKVIAAAALQGAIFRATKIAVDRGSRTAFANLTGTWPGEERPEQQ